MRGSSKNNQDKISHTANSKKLFNLIFFSVSTLIDKLDVLIEENPEIFDSKERGFDYENKISEWTMKLIEIR